MPLLSESTVDKFCGGRDLWGPQTNVNSSDYDGAIDFSTCFEDSVLTSVPAATLVLMAIGRIFLLSRAPKVQGGLTRHYLTKQIAGMLLCGLTVSLAAYEVYHNSAPFRIVSPVVIAVGLILAQYVLSYEHSRGIRSSSVLTVFWILTLFVDIVRIRSFSLEAKHHRIHSWLHFALFIPQIALDVLMFGLAAVQEPEFAGARQSPTVCPEENAPFFSIISFWWLNPLMALGFSRALTAEDLWDVNENDKAAHISRLFQQNWDIEMTKFHQGRAPSLVSALFRSFGFTFMVGGLFKFVQDVLAFVSPQLLKYVINFATPGNEEPAWHGYVYACGLFLAAAVQSIFLHQYFHRVMKTGMRLRSAIVSAIYSKALRLSNTARQSTTSGEIVNLMSVDAQRFMDLMAYIQMIWSAPLQIALSLYFLWAVMGAATLAGLGVMIVMIPLNGYLAKKSRALQLVQMKQKDQRIKTMNEVLAGMRVIKLYAWEIPFERKIQEIRGGELKVLRSASYLSAIASFTWSCAPFIVSFVTFITYTTTGGNLTADRAFVALSLFNLLRFPLSMLPIMITSMVEAQVSLKRIVKFLTHPEIDPNIVTKTGPVVEEQDPSVDPSLSKSKEGGSPPSETLKPVITCDDGKFAWSKDNSAALQDICLRIRPRSLVGVVGRVGSGKTSLMSALLGEMEVVGGRVVMPTSVAYVPQQAWIRNATLRDNILFGKPFDAVKYRRVLKACALEPDLETLPGGDMTEIGEKGINLSGGQKQRVSLARAVYQEADVYILDDPLSAVDSHVGKHIFAHVVGPQGLLRGKIRVLVTHAIKYLPQTDMVIVMRAGKIAEHGSYETLLENKGEFAKFMEEYQQEAKEVETLEPQLSSESASSGSPSKDKEREKEKEISESKPAKPQKGADESNEKTVLIEKEKSAEGGVKLSVYISYLRAITWTVTILLVLGYMVTYALQVLSNYWLSYWSEKSDKNPEKVHGELSKYLGVYGAFGISNSLGILFTSLMLSLGAIKASRKMHTDMLKCILRSPMSFFDTTPLGRIVNRFSKDIYVIDETIPQSLRSFIATFMQVVSTLVVISYSTPYFMIAIVPLIVFYYYVQKYYVASSRQLNRLESVSRSPIYAHFGETLSGVSSIRAYNQVDTFINENYELVNKNMKAYYPSICANRWLALRLEFLGNLIILFAALFAVIEKGKVNPGVVGLSLSYAMSVTQTLNWMVRMSSQLETDIVAIERVYEYTCLPQEAPAIMAHRPTLKWPAEGRVKFDHYSTRYREGLDLVVRDISASVRGGEKIGICGRTGAGKSSLTLALFRIIEASTGSISIDEEEISRIGLQDLRSKITIMPQDPVLFSGTVRSNLDPFSDYSDQQLWSAIETSHLKDHISTLDGGLEAKVSEGGENFSVGQRQLICLARAVLRKTKVLVLDEATAAVDLETDDLIQETIRTEFKDCTILTIAHRLNTIMDSDRIMVLDKGRVVEFDTPNALLSTPTSVFHGMAKAAGLA